MTKITGAAIAKEVGVLTSKVQEFERVINLLSGVKGVSIPITKLCEERDKYFNESVALEAREYVLADTSGLEPLEPYTDKPLFDLLYKWHDEVDRLQDEVDNSLIKTGGFSTQTIACEKLLEEANSKYVELYQAVQKCHYREIEVDV